MKMKIYCVIVCYNPDFSNLSKICRTVSASGANVILVDNSLKCTLKELAEEICVELLHLGCNEGIAKAQNIGIRKAIGKDADVIVFFDQDSQIQDDFLSKLIHPLKADEPKVTSPVFYDKEQGFRYPNYVLNKYGLIKEVKPEVQNSEYKVDIIISSGSAVTRRTFELVGLMDEDFFIDFVDTEWALRCKAKGIPVLVVPDAVMIHTIGEKSINLGIMRMFVHSPVRTYYKVRNPFIFIGKKDVPFLLGIKEIISALIHNFLIILVVTNKSSYFKNYFQAIWDGAFGHVGKKK